MKHESTLCHVVTISKPFRRSNYPREELEQILAACPLPVKKVTYENVYIPVSDAEHAALEKAGIQFFELGNSVCKAATQAQVYIEGEYGLEQIEEAMNNEQEHIRVFVDFFYEAQ